MLAQKFPPSINLGGLSLLKPILEVNFRVSILTDSKGTWFKFALFYWINEKQKLEIYSKGLDLCLPFPAKHK